MKGGFAIEDAGGFVNVEEDEDSALGVLGDGIYDG